MKRGLALMLTLVLTLALLAVPAMAAEITAVVYNLKVDGGYTVSLKTANGDAAAAFTGIVGGNTGTVYGNAAKLTLTFTGQAGKQYMVFLLEGKEVPTEDSIQYINQAAGDDTVNFDIYPKDMTEEGTYHLYVSGTDLDYNQVATFSVTKSWEKAPYTLGDVNLDGKVTINDALMILQSIVGDQNLTEQQRAAANVDATNSAINVNDALKIMNFVVGNIDTL